MAKASLVRELLVKTQNKVGMLAQVTDAIGATGANITALHAFGVDKDAIFRIITTDNAKAIKGIKAKKIEVSEKDVVSVELENKPGQAAEMGSKLKDAGIDIKYIYGTTCGCECACTIVFNSSDNRKAVEVINK